MESQSPNTPYLNVAFYKFVELNDLVELRDTLRRKFAELPLRGTVLLGAEGINCCAVGRPEAIEKFRAILAEYPEFRDLDMKESWSSYVTFKRMLVKIKKEIIPLGKPEIKPSQFTAPRLSPEELKQWLDEKQDVVLLDTRNDYEFQQGTFENALTLDIQHFRTFPEKLEAVKNQIKDKKVVMFCTGGIRCEKATAYAMNEGFKDVYQLDGGILRYFEKVGGAHYKGDCFVFDKRRGVNAELSEVTATPADPVAAI